MDKPRHTHVSLLKAACEAEDTFTEDELESAAQEFCACPMCGGHGNSLGLLGALHHFRCRQCGADFSREVPVGSNRPSISAMVDQAEIEVERLRGEGWEQPDFVNALTKMLGGHEDD